MFRRALLAAFALAALGCTPTLAQSPPKTFVPRINPAATATAAPIEVQDGTGQWVPFGVVNPTTHGFVPSGVGGSSVTAPNGAGASTTQSVAGWVAANAAAAATAQMTANGAVQAAGGDASGTKILIPGGTSRNLTASLSDRINLVNLGAVADFNGTSGTDNTAKLTAALAQGKCVYAPAGIYLLSSTVSAPAGAPLCILGDGKNATVLVFGPGAGDGLVATPNDFRDPSTIQGLTVATLGNETGAGIKVTYPDAAAVTFPYNEQFVLRDVEIRGYSAMAQGWAQGVALYDVQWFRLDDFNVIGRRVLTNGQQTAVGDQNMTDCVYITNGQYDVGMGFMRAFQCYESVNGVRASSPSEMEGLNISAFNIVEVGNGIVDNLANQGPGLAINDGHLNVFTSGISGTNTSDCEISNLLVYKNPYALATTTAISLATSNYCSIANITMKNQTTDANVSGGWVGYNFVNSSYNNVTGSVIERPSTAFAFSESSQQNTGANVKLLGSLTNGKTVLINDTSTGSGQNVVRGTAYYATYKNTGSQSPGSGYASAVSTGLVQVYAGQRYRVTAKVAMTNGSTAGEALLTVYQPGSTGTATYTFDAPSASQLVYRGPINASESVNQQVTGILTVTGSGTLQLDLLPQLTGSTGSMAAGGAQITVEAF